jgi:hypothetical protein
VKPANLMAFGLQHSPEHPAAGEGVVEGQLVDPAHEREIGVRHRPRQGVDAAPTEPERLGLAADAEAVGAVDHRLALANRPASARAIRTKIVLERQLADLRVQGLHVHGRRRLCLRRLPKDPRSAVQELRAPLRDLVRMHVELLGQLRQRLLALDDATATFALTQ